LGYSNSIDIDIEQVVFFWITGLRPVVRDVVLSGL